MKNNENTFEKLEVWKEAHELTLLIYKITKKFPEVERYRLVDQLCRAASSVPANIVEGNSRGLRKEYRQFAFQAKGSLEEVKYHLLLAKDLQYLDAKTYMELLSKANQVSLLLNGLIKYLNSSIEKSKI